MDKILLMIQLQLQLNDATNGEAWREGFTKTGNPINWRRCIYMECAEMIDSFAWKHWKDLNQAPDWANLQIEVVDVWHFIISLALEEYAKQMKGELEDLALHTSTLSNFDALYNKNIQHGAQHDIITKVEDLMRLSLQKESFEIEEMVEKFFDLVLLSGLDLDTLYRLYVGKNILNQKYQTVPGYTNQGRTLSIGANLKF